MEYDMDIRKIGGSFYLHLPPKLITHYKLKDRSEVRVRESDRMFVVQTEKPKIDKAGRDFLNLRFNLGGKEFSRAEIYETDRY